LSCSAVIVTDTGRKPPEIRLGRTVGGIGEAEPLEQLVGRRADRRPQLVSETTDQLQVLSTRGARVDGRVPAGESDTAADRVRIVGS
jgi:hypothetical protein